MIFALLCISYSFSQQKDKPVFNESYWNAYADKIQLTGKNREEFISSHKKLNSPAPYQGVNGIVPKVFQKIPDDQNNILMAGPCVNADFEFGNLTGWVTSSGFNPGFNPFGCCPNGGGQQAIMTAGPNDPYGAFPVVFPGGTYSLRLGNNVNGGQADRIEQTFLVSPINANFSYKYAVVLEDPNHSMIEQPSFQVEMLDSSNVQIPCTYFYVSAGQGIPGFFNSPTPGVIYKPWTTVLVDLTPYIGQNVTIRFTTYDCSLGGHFGYAYIDGVCQAFVGGGDATVCAGSSTTFCAPSGLASYTWNGPGVVNAVGQCVNVNAPGVYTVQTTLFTNCNGPPFTYTLYNQPAPIPNAGPNVTVCANNNVVSLSGSITGYSSTPVWSTSGNGVFTSTANLTTTYTPGPADITAGFVNIILTTANNGVCPPATSTLQVLITPSPVVNAGSNQTVCSNGLAVLNGTVTGPTNTGSWTTSGTGVFSPGNNVLNPNYIPSVADIFAGSVTLTLTSTGNGICNPVSRTVSIAFTQIATVTATPPQNVCSNAGTISLTGTITGGTSTGSWTSNGSGSYIPGPGLVNTTYSFSPADVGLGTLIFTLTSTNNGPCAAIANTTTLIITPISTVSAGANQLICSNAGTIALTGNVNPGSPIWSTGGSGNFTPNNAVANPVYVLSPGDLLAGFVTFTLSGTNNGPCPDVEDSVKVPIKTLAVVNAGPSQSICATATTLNLSGNITGGTNTGFWSTSGAGIFNPSNTVLNPTYSINPSDPIAGIIIFTLTSTNNSPCPAVTNTLSLSFFPLAIVNAGPNQVVCSNAGTIGLNASSTNMGFWSTDGAGLFIPINNILNPSYSITTADILAGSVSFTFFSANNGACPVVQDSVKMVIKTLATVNASPSQSICSSTATVNLTGTVSGGTSSGMWTTTGGGAFLPGQTFLNTTYFVTGTDITAGLVNFTLASTNNGPCPAVIDTLSLTIYKLAILNSGPNQALCSNTGSLSLTGSVISLSNTGIWSSNGSGTYNPGNTSLNTTYSISLADINAGSVTFSLSSTNNGPCPMVIDTVKMSIKKLAVVNAGPDLVVCSTNSLLAISGSVTAGSTAGIWSHNGSGSLTPNVNALNINYGISQQDINNGLVKLALTSLNNGVCPAVIDTVKIIIYENPVIKLVGDTSICSYQNPFNIKPIITGDYSQVLWTTSGLGNFIPNNFTNPVKYDIKNDISNGQVVLSVTTLSSGPCANISGSIRVVMHRAPVADFTASTFTGSVANPIKFTNQSVNANTYFWDFGDGGFSYNLNPVHSFFEVGNYDVTLVAYSQYGCTDTATKKFLIISDIQFPNVFTPNLGGSNGGAYNVNDYSNDVFFPYTSGVTEYNLKIFNRWGELIFESNELKVGWDGYFKGKLCQQDAYVWKADVKFFDGRTYNKTGSVTLLR